MLNVLNRLHTTEFVCGNLPVSRVNGEPRWNIVRRYPLRTISYFEGKKNAVKLLKEKDLTAKMRVFSSACGCGPFFVLTVRILSSSSARVDCLYVVDFIIDSDRDPGVGWGTSSLARRYRGSRTNRIGRTKSTQRLGPLFPRAGRGVYGAWVPSMVPPGTARTSLAVSMDCQLPATIAGRNEDPDHGPGWTRKSPPIAFRLLQLAEPAGDGVEGLG
jgi:hypothetical protein